MPGFFMRSKVRARSKFFWAGLLRMTGVLALGKSWTRRRGVVVLTFHRVLRDPDLELTASLPGMVVREETFDRFLNYAAANCEFLDLTQEADLAPNSRLKLAVTFDDGWSDNAVIASPLARKHGVPMLIFIVPEKTGVALPFWPERAASALEQRLRAGGRRQDRGRVEQAIEDLKGLSAEERDRQLSQLASASGAPRASAPVDTTMTWEQIEQLRSMGVSFGSHTATHEILVATSLGRAEEEITGSRRQIEQKLGAPCLLFSYPNGDCSDDVRELVRRAGYRRAFLNRDPGIWTNGCDPYLIPRVNVCEYHLVDANGDFSPLIFDYAVVWSAVKGHLAKMGRAAFAKLRRNLSTPKDPKKHEGFSRS
jgi:peptidoglycan/xylan/chitin deacetylase (PgdA/CDA1 family)